MWELAFIGVRRASGQCQKFYKKEGGHLKGTAIGGGFLVRWFEWVYLGMSIAGSF